MRTASAPFAAASSATARPTPWVEPVTIRAVPARDRFIVAQLDFYLEKNRKIVPYGQAVQRRLTAVMPPPINGEGR
jgi:hypothetical protein